VAGLQIRGGGGKEEEEEEKERRKKKRRKKKKKKEEEEKRKEKDVPGVFLLFSPSSSIAGKVRSSLLLVI